MLLPLMLLHPLASLLLLSLPLQLLYPVMPLFLLPFQVLLVAIPSVDTDTTPNAATAVFVAAATVAAASV